MKNYDGIFVTATDKEGIRLARGANAGHTVYKNNQKIVLHQIPSGVMRSDCKCLLGNGII